MPEVCKGQLHGLWIRDVSQLPGLVIVRRHRDGQGGQAAVCPAVTDHVGEAGVIVKQGLIGREHQLAQVGAGYGCAQCVGTAVIVQAATGEGGNGDAGQGVGVGPDIVIGEAEVAGGKGVAAGFIQPGDATGKLDRAEAGVKGPGRIILAGHREGDGG